MTLLLFKFDNKIMAADEILDDHQSLYECPDDHMEIGLRILARLIARHHANEARKDRGMGEANIEEQNAFNEQQDD